jgi:hypothetical protein
MSQTLYRTDERSIGVDVLYERTGSYDDPEYRIKSYTVFDLDRVNDTTKDLWDLEFDTEREALAVARDYIRALGLEVNQ